MAYDVQITRNPEWWNEEPGGGISLSEWRSYLEIDESMQLVGSVETTSTDSSRVRYENEGLAVWIDHSGHNNGEARAYFDHRSGRVVVKNPDEEVLQKMHAIAVQLVARVFGEEGEEYDENGVVKASLADQSGEHKKPWWKLW